MHGEPLRLRLGGVLIACIVCPYLEADDAREDNGFESLFVHGHLDGYVGIAHSLLRSQGTEELRVGLHGRAMTRTGCRLRTLFESQN